MCCQAVVPGERPRFVDYSDSDTDTPNDYEPDTHTTIVPIDAAIALAAVRMLRHDLAETDTRERLVRSIIRHIVLHGEEDQSAELAELDSDSDNTDDEETESDNTVEEDSDDDLPELIDINNANTGHMHFFIRGPQSASNGIGYVQQVITNTPLNTAPNTAPNTTPARPIRPIQPNPSILDMLMSNNMNAHANFNTLSIE